MKKRTLLAAFLTIFTLACSINLAVTPTPDTATPFVPLPETATPEIFPSPNATLSETWTRTPTPTPSATLTPSALPATATQQAATCPQLNPDFETQVITLINIERAKQGLSALAAQTQLANTAQIHSVDMTCNNYFSHTDRDGSSFSERATRQGYAMGAGAENIAAGYTSATEVVAGWMNSPGHRANILGDYIHIGVGYSYGADSAYGHYWTAVFGSP
jgi:uncharacterized protein YkwD